MSDMIILTMKRNLAPQASNLIDKFLHNKTLCSEIKGRCIKEIQILRNSSKNLPIPIQLFSPKTYTRENQISSSKSILGSPLASPRSLGVNNTQKTLSKTPTRREGRAKTFKINSRVSQRQNIKEILKNSLKQEQKRRKIAKTKVKKEMKSRLDKKIKLQILNEFIREDNLNKKAEKNPEQVLKQESKPRNTKKDLKKTKKKLKKNSFTLISSPKSQKSEVFSNKNSQETLDDFYDHKNEIFKQIKDLSIRLDQLRSDALKINQDSLKKIVRIFENFLKKQGFSALKSLTPASTSLTQFPSRVSKVNENLLESQIRFKQDQLLTLKLSDLQEMRELAGVIGSSNEVKRQFELMIERRYAKLENFFQENLNSIKQALEIERNFESSSNENLNIGTNEESAFHEYSSEVDSEKIEFPAEKKMVFLIESQDEPNFPLVPDSLTENKIKLKGSLDSLEELVDGINGSNEYDYVNENTLDLNTPQLEAPNLILILDESYGSGESGSNGNYSSIICQTEELKNESNSVSKNIEKIVTEKYPRPFPDLPESSIELEGYELIINRVIFMLQNYLFEIVLEEVKNDDDYWTDLQRYSMIPAKPVLFELENQAKSDLDSILTSLQYLKSQKTPEELLESVSFLYNPLLVFRIIQENYEGDMQIFEYSNIEKLNFSENSLDLNPYRLTHNKALVDALNESIIKSSKKYVNVPWKIRNQPFAWDYDIVVADAVLKIIRWCQIEGGKIPSKEMINCLGNLDQENLQKIRKKNLESFLVFDMNEDDGLWVECDFEETETAIDISSAIFDELLGETIHIIRYI